MAEGAPQVAETENVQKLNEYTRGDIDQGFAAAEVTLERTYRTSFEIHQPLEPHASIAAPWVPGAPTVLLGNMPALDDTSKLMCTWGGVISVAFPGQVTEQIP